MIYKFVCPKCGKKEIEMPIDKYDPKGHKCECGEELKRDASDFCRSYTVNCDGFYSKHQSGN